MTHSLAGLVVLNLLFLVAGSGILWGIRGWRTWGEYAALGGAAYMSGLSAVGVLATLIPIYGGGLGVGAILGLAAGVGAAGVTAGAHRRRSLPPVPRWPKVPRSPLGLLSGGIALVVVAMLVSFFRVARIQPMTSWDAWAFWMTKAKGIYFFGGLPPWIFEHVAGPSYPLFVPTLAAMNFRFMGAADTTTLGVQWWLLVVGFVWAAAGLLGGIAPPAVTLLFLLTAIAIPELDRRLLERTGDWPLDILFAVAACSLLSWIVTREAWRLAVYGSTLSAMLLTKREGQLLAACLVVGGLVAAGMRNWRAWVAIAGVAVLAYVPDIPWRIWWSSRGLLSDAPPGGWVHATFGNGSRVLPSFHLVLRLLFAYDLWLAVAPIALIAAALCLLSAEARPPALFFLVTFGLGIVAWAWVNWSDPAVVITTNAALNPTNRAVGSLVLLSAVAGPVIIGRILGRHAPLETAVVEVAS